MTEVEMESASIEMDLPWLLSPVSQETFTKEYWGKNPLRISRDDNAYHSRLLSELSMEFVLHSACRTSGAVEILAEDDKPQYCRSHEQAIKAFHKGKSLRIDAIQRFSFPITSLCCNLERIINSPINVNMYLTPGSGKKALKRHYDTHDVFVLQVHGNKIWRTYTPSFASPLEFMPLQRQESIAEMKQFRLGIDMSGRDNCVLAEEFTLKAGDCLYLPRGVWHEAESEPDKISCHLTVGIQPTTYLDILNVALSRLAIADVDLRQSLPFGFATEQTANGTIAKQVTKIVERLSQVLDTSAALNELTAHFFRRSRTGFENNLLHPIDSTLVDNVTIVSKIRMRRGIICGVNGAVSPAQIHFGSQIFAISPAYEEACRFISTAKQFEVSWLPGNLSASEKLVLVRQLISEGLLVSIPSDVNSQVAVQTKGRNWLPIQLDMEKKTIRWMDFGARPLSEPFFHQTVKQYEQEKLNPRFKITSLRALNQIKEDISPSGFIFHMSRCGSTLLANGLKALPHTVVVSESPTINAALSITRCGEIPEAMDQEALLRGLVNAYSQRRIGKEKAFVIKFSSWNILQVTKIRQLWPNVPCVIVIRDPLEVAVSCLAEPPGWMRWRVQKEEFVKSLLNVDTEAISKMSESVFCARILAEFLKSADAGLRTGCQIIDYKNLMSTNIGNIAQLFGIDFGPKDLTAIEHSLSIYSKDLYGKRPFVDDNVVKQAKATDALRSEVDTWAREAYENLILSSRKVQPGTG